MTSYNYIAIEGVIGAGKTTYAHYLSNQLSARLFLEEFEDNPFLPAFYADGEKYAFPLELSFLASRYSQIKQVIEKRDMFSERIVSDFVLYKSLVFASINLHGDESELYKKLFHIMFHQIPVPDLTLYLHLPIEKLQQNIQKRGRDYEQNISNLYLTQLQDNYFQYFKQLSNHRIVVLSIENQDILHNPKTKEWIDEIVSTDFPLGITYL